MMRMDRAGLVENDVFANSLRMLADPYKCLKKVAIDYHPHRRILENAKYEYYERLQIMRTSYKRFANEANVSRMLAELFSFVTYSQAL